MKIISNIRFISLLPIIIALMMGSYIAYNKYIDFVNTKQMQKNLQTISKLKTLLVKFSFERSTAILNFTSNSNIYAIQYKDRIDQTNKSVSDIVKIYNENKNDEIIYKIIKDIKSIVNNRQSILDKKIKYKKFFYLYDRLNQDILLKIEKLKYPSVENFIYDIDSYIKSISLIKSISDERDFISTIFKNSDDINNLYILKLFKKNSFIHTFETLNKDVKTILTQELNNIDFIKIMNKSSNIKKELLEQGYITDTTLAQWHNLENKKIKLLDRAIDKIYTNILSKSQFNNELTIGILSLILLSLTILIFSLIKYFQITKYLLHNIKRLKVILQKVLNENIVNKKIDINTTQGLDEAYELINTTIDKIEIEKQKAQNENASKTIFLANMSHEIRTPINGIVGFTDLLKQSNLTKEQREYIDIISRSTDNLLEIINNILDLSKINSKKVEVESITFSPIEEFESPVELFVPKASKKNINLSLFMDPNFENYLIGDPLKIKEVLLNLISNAIKFTPEGGEVAVRIKKLKSKDNSLENIYFEVSDNGIGMDEEEMNEVFDAFTQADATVTRKYGGTGLGLTISSNYVSLMGGKLEVYSKKNKGTTFYFTLKLKKSQPLKTKEYRHFFNHVTPLIITDNENKELAEFLKMYFSYFATSASYIYVYDIQKNIALFDRSNLIIVPRSVYEHNNFSYLKQTNKKLLVIEHTKELSKEKSQEDNEYFRLIEPIGFFKTVKILDEMFPIKDKKGLLPQHDKSKSKDNYKILVAEDNDINLQLIEKFLSKYQNINLVTTKDGQEALDRFMTDKFDLVLMDIAMPVLDGISATKKMLEYEQINSLEHTPIVALSANALKGDRERFMSAGLDEYLTKPIKQDQLLNTLSKFGIEAKRGIKTSQVSKSNKIIPDHLNKRDILIFKKSKVESKIFQKVLSSIYKDIDIVENEEEFFQYIKQNYYKAILLDKEIPNFDFDKLYDIKKDLQNSVFILFRNFESKVENKLRAIFDEVIINSSDKEYLQTILDNYLKR